MGAIGDKMTVIDDMNYIKKNELDKSQNFLVVYLMPGSDGVNMLATMIFAENIDDLKWRIYNTLGFVNVIAIFTEKEVMEGRKRSVPINNFLKSIVD